MSMNVSDHPELEQIKDYLNNCNSDKYSGLRLHLAQCSQCRSLTETLMALQQNSHQVMSEDAEHDALTEHEHQQIADYIDGRLSEAEHQQQKDFIHSTPLALKAALHYASHKSAMDKAELVSAADTSFASSPDTGISGFGYAVLQKIKALTAFQAPVWLTVPVTAGLVALLTINLLELPTAEQASYKIASYQDNAVIQYGPKDHLPGIGFFTKSSQLSEVYDNLKVSVSDDARFTLQWPAVARAVKYTMRLQMFHQGNKTVLGEVTTKQPSAVIATRLDDIYHRYEWVLSGETSDNRVFLANGGFVIENLEKGTRR